MCSKYIIIGKAKTDKFFKSLDIAATALLTKKDAFVAKLDKMSTDIRLLESQVQKAGLSIPVCINLTRNGDTTPRERRALREVRERSGGAPVVSEWLAWARHEECGKFRLLYRREIEDGDGNDVGTSDFPDGTIDERPLIECPAEIRLQAHGHLPKLLSFLSTEVSVQG